MTDHVILRHAKLKSFGEIGGSLDHTYRLIDTPNADHNRSDLNEHDFNKKTDVLEALKNRIDQRVSKRPDNVLCVEYLVTASPTWDGWGTDKETEFFNIQKERLIKKWGAENVISTHIHRDETTPHLVVYIVPFDEEKQALNCKKWLGNRTLLQEEQTEAAEVVKHLGLSRGIKNSKAEHRTIKQHYEIVNQTKDINEFSPSIDNLPEPTLTDRLNPKKYAERVIEQVLPDYKNAKIESIKALETQQEVKALREIAKKAEPYLNAVDIIPEHRIKDLNSVINEATNKINNYEKEKENKIIEEINNKLDEHNNVSNIVFDFNIYYESELKNKILLEKSLSKDRAKTEKWLEKNDLTEKNVSSGWDKNGNKLYIDTPDYYLDLWNYNNKLSMINNDFKNKINKKYEDCNMSNTLSYLKNNEEYNNKKINNLLNKIDSDVMPVIAEYQLEQQQLKQQKEHDDTINAHRIAQNAIREREIQAGREAYQDIKRAENRAYRANESTIEKSSDKKELSRDSNNDLSM
ncbi:MULTISPECIES: MobV family relaxase [unclassified Acinetobacter]|uniref:MobV family relaxase n=1 Tax=unclassified Acinetobacter TaxID=196816 RepID=UPI0029351AE7|nr:MULTISPECIES: MobV family relaxase [unclassified Acinetobacter]WOE33440.1 MobV family relaxase [Acinetobacter sp. SAAs470]WOE39947.1 MobV family relaxase [Acinetobacter sp. SAAs474]